ncbi:uncharacterized protein LOC107823753 isoform X2 [Nicotiana tabacum]|uniref:Uncharacterized protein LOC107823753 isoform X2 n=1 Tax=Nicotiana tabacum TaxID=4097 RepID=A0A1S4CY72_TOBAC|nr:PREDICTED: uncharacterized protein LOC107823753 isoform X2 [Nicotiana tabacum]
MSTSCATAGTKWLNPTGNRLAVPGRSNHFRGRWELNRRNFAINRIVVTGASVMPPSVVAESSQGLQQLPFKPEGYNYWTWRGHKIHYVEEGEGFPVVLIHGFGTSAFHWRYNIPELAKKYKVYALDLLGFGWSEKARIDYDALIWRDQVVDFLKEIVKQPTVLVGNGLGGFTTLLAAAALPAEQVKGVSLLNSAGQFGDDVTTTDKTEETALHKFIVRPVEEIFQRVVVGLAFWLTMQPAQIEAQLKSGVYRNHSNVDDYLVNSIAIPAADPNAEEVYYRYGAILENLKSREDLLEKIKGCIVDSGGDPDISPKVWAAGFTTALLQKRSSSVYPSVEAGEGIEVQSGLTSGNIQGKEPMLMETLLLAAFEKLFSFLLNLPDVNARLRKIISALVKNQPSCPQLYLYSSADKVIPIQSVESFIEEQRKSGRKVHSFNFRSSPHVDHYRTFPDIYVSVLQKFLEESMLVPNGVYQVESQVSGS